MKSRNHDEAVIEMLRKDPDFATEYLKVAFEEMDEDGGEAAFLMALRHIVEARGGMTQLAEKTGFSQEDAELLKEALKTLFENDASSARPEGSMEVCKMYWWQHDEKTPAVSSGKIQRGFEIKPKKEHPREFTDYEISWHVDGCKEPEEFDFV